MEGVPTYDGEDENADQRVGGSEETRGAKTV